MHKVDVYLLKNTVYFFVLANIIPLIFTVANLSFWTNGIALLLSLLMLFLIRLTVRRYAEALGKGRAEVKQLLGEYIEDKRRGKLSFYAYLKKRKAQDAAAAAAPAVDSGL
jgi:membrane protein implicated in regulation of membrane protease activity